MFPWNLFDGKKDFDPFQYLNDHQLQNLIKQLNNQPFPDFFKGWLQGPFQQRNPVEQEKKIKEYLFETHENIYIRIPIPDQQHIRNIKIYYTLDKCVIEGPFFPDSPHTIALPTVVKRKGAKALYKDGTLEIKLPKKLNLPFVEVDVEKK